jgi:hypothetical protein
MTMSMEEMLGQTNENVLSCVNTQYSDHGCGGPYGARFQIDEFGRRVQGGYDPNRRRKLGSDDGSMHSHATTEVLDERKVSFVHIGGLPNKEDGSEDSFNEQDMVYYHKDDLTQYSKHLGLNKVKRKQ